MTPPGPLLASIFGLYLLAVITPGPNTFIVTRLALSATRRHAAWAVLGIGLGNAAWLCVTLGASRCCCNSSREGCAPCATWGGCTCSAWG
jgi:threonine/homoserine/homoserine lactone efflux protein